MGKILQYTSAAYLIVIMLIKMMGMQLVVLDYQLNRDFIAANLCENRFSPEKRCAGKCYLRKQLTSNNENSGSQEEKGGSKTFSVDYFETVEQIVFSCTASAIIHRSAAGHSALSAACRADIFHPPLC